MATSPKVQKVCLKNTPMYYFGVSGGNHSKFELFDWKIGDYFQLNFNRSYSIYLPKRNTRFSVTKSKRAVSVTIVTDQCKITDCYVCYSNYILTGPVAVRESSQDTYRFEIPYNVVNHSENIMLSSGNLVLLFQGEEREEVSLPLCPFNGKKLINPHDVLLFTGHYDRMINKKDDFPREDEEIGRSLATVCEAVLFTDFTIRVRKTTFRVHKALLAARSKFFEDYINENCEDNREIEIDTTCVAMGAVLCFLYSGRIEISSPKIISSVLKLARTLKLYRLHYLCSVFLQNYTNIGHSH